MESESPSKTVVRQQRHQWELSYITLDTVFKAKGIEDLKELLDRDIYENEKYQHLPKFRQLALQAYFQGICDAIARISGTEVPPIRLKTVPPKKTRKVKVKAPVIYDPPVKQTPLPAWAAPTQRPVPIESAPAPKPVRMPAARAPRQSMTMVPPPMTAEG